MHGDYNRLEEYGVIGNLETVALVSRDGGIDWCCFPHVESPSLFARLLDHDRGGHFTLQPTQSYRSEQQYVEDTNVLQTHFETASGTLTVTDFMPVPGTSHASLSTIYRQVTCESGHVDVDVIFEPRFDFARVAPPVEPTQDGVVAKGDGERVSLSSTIPLSTSSASASASVSLEADETRWLVLSYESEPLSSPPRIQRPDPEMYRRIRDEVIDYWQEWVHRCNDQSACPVGVPWHDLAVRSALVLKLLIHHPTGAICAAPTTSLPEIIGSVRNWDYRYNWIRDAAFTVQALSGMGHTAEAEEYFELCLDHCRRHDPAAIPPVYGLHGDHVPPEQVLDHLSGYRQSVPVRIGNAARQQQQLDVYGELVLGFYETLRYTNQLTADDWKVVKALVEHACDEWDEPDFGIWEVRSTPRHFVYSKVMCWVALDRGIELAEKTGVEGPIERWRTCRKDIKQAVLEHGFNDRINSFVRAFETRDALDATSLLIPVVGFLPVDDPRVQGTIDATLERLTTGEGLVYRYDGDDGLPGEEGAFVLCSFWLVDALALSGRIEEATEIYRNTLKYASPLGLFAEEIDPATGEQRGNFPQAFSHIGLINSTIYLSRARSNTN